MIMDLKFWHVYIFFKYIYIIFFLYILLMLKTFCASDPDVGRYLIKGRTKYFFFYFARYRITLKRLPSDFR